MNLGIKLGVTRRGGGGAAWTPLTPGTPALLLTNDLASYQKDDGGGGYAAAAAGDPVKRWLDTSGNARHFDQATLANRPPLQFSGGKYFLSGNGSSYFLAGPALPLSGGFTVGMRSRRAGATAAFEMLLSSNPAAVNLELRHNPADQFSLAWDAVGSTAANTGAAATWVVTQAAGNYTWQQDGVTISSGAMPARDDVTPFYLLCRGGASFFAAGDVAAVVVYPSVLGGSDLASLKTWLDARL